MNVNDASSPSYPEAAPGADPHPSNPGMWLGADVNEYNCFRDLNPGKWTSNPDNDKDNDWMYDDCEFKIASAFRPFLFSDGACMGGEPYYAVKYFYYAPQARRYVRVLYMLYYDDCGYWYDGEPGSGPGDGERIQLNVAFDGTSHWLFHSMNLSDHGEFHYYTWQTTSFMNFPRVTYGGQATPYASYRDYPNVWVSHGKHANFVDEDQCEAFFGSASPDRCVSGGGGRVFVTESRNVGEVRHDGSSSPWNASNPDGCYPSVNPARANNGREECYLIHKPFFGWYPGNPTDGGSYREDMRLTYSYFWDGMAPSYVAYGFGPNPPPPKIWISGSSSIPPYQSMTWTAVVNAPAPYSLQWYVDGSPAESGESITRWWPPNESHQLQVFVYANGGTTNSSAMTVSTYNQCAGGGACEEYNDTQKPGTIVPLSAGGKSARPAKAPVTVPRKLPKQ